MRFYTVYISLGSVCVTAAGRCCRFHSFRASLLLLGPGFRSLAPVGVLCRAFSAPSLEPCVSRGARHFTLPHALLGALGAFRVKMLNLTPFSADQAECELRLCRGMGWKVGKIDECRVKGLNCGNNEGAWLWWRRRYKLWC